MQLELTTPRQAVDNAFLQETIGKNDFERFRQRLLKLLNHADDAVEGTESEEHMKNLIQPFLRNTNFGEEYFIYPKERQDLAIHNGKTRNSSVGVIIEAKRPSNKEMITTEDCNRKALHETILYYLRERLQHENEDIKHIIITDSYRWFIFDAHDFERHFYESKTLRKWYSEWDQGQKVSKRTQFVYDHLSDCVDELDVSIKATHIDITKYRKLLEKDELSRGEQKKLVPLFKFFTPTQLLKLPFSSDSNKLNKGFYRELLYIMGLKEYKKKGTHYITRQDEENREPASLIENTITQLESLNVLSQLKNVREYGDNEDEQLFNVALELLITWINRILFLKLLEAQLYKYHREDEKFRFLNHKEVEQYDWLNKLFFQVLAVPIEDRSERITKIFGHIPYLNSSLFDVAGIERATIRISELEDTLQMPVYSRSKIRNRGGERLKGESLSTLEYLLRFLDAYNFNTEGTAEIQEEAKSLINASVLGRIFEKINGYKDGSFFTPGYITEYMCRETIRRAVVQKFSEVLPSLPSSPSPQTPLPLAGEGLQPEASPQESGDLPSPASGRGAGGEGGVSWKLSESLIETARYLRQNQTEPEKLLWELLRNRQLGGYKFRRQHPVKPGFVLDFYCAKEKLAVEVDGGYHNDPDQKAADEERSGLIGQKGIRVIRFTNEQVLENTEWVLGEILKALAASLPSPPSPQTPLPHVGEGLSPEAMPHELPSPAGGGRIEDGGESANQTSGRGAGGEGELTFSDIHNAIGRDISIKEANEIINSITICDPAVGSGHFLVSALNELIAIKSDLRIFVDENNHLIRDVSISVEKDELNVAVGQEPFFEYRVNHEWKPDGKIERRVGPDTQRLQKALFREKNILIENCLFGVDINPNSVNICRLRLWIELLKNAYYREDTGYQALEVLPNIDINIKQGNSLVSRFGLDADLSSVFSKSDHSLEDYKEAVRNYKHTGDRDEKRRLQMLIGTIKDEYSTTLYNNRPVNKKLSKARGRLDLMQNADLFGDRKFTKKEVKKQEKSVQQLEAQKEEEESGAFYNEAFEWRFEFPEVLDEEGVFKGFDVVIGNPPYIRQEQFKELKPYFKKEYEVYQGTADLYTYFIERGMNVLKQGGWFQYIVSNKWMRANYGKPLREFIQRYQIESIIDFGDLPVFEEATAYPCLLQLKKDEVKASFDAVEINNLEFDDIEAVIEDGSFNVDQLKLRSEGWSLISTEEQDLISKIENKAKKFKDVVGENIYRGVISGLDAAFIIDDEKKCEILSKDKKSSELIFPYLRGKDVGKYSALKSSQYIIFMPSGWTDKKSKGADDKWAWLKGAYPGVAGHLELFRERAKKRYDQGKYWWELRPCDYFEEFKSPKLLYLKFQVQPAFTLDLEGHICNSAVWFMSEPNKQLLAILNSSLGWYLISNYCTQIQNGYQLIYKYLKNIPIVLEEASKPKIESLVDQILTAKQDDPDADTSDLEAEIDRLVYELYGLSEEEIGIVEGRNKQ